MLLNATCVSIDNKGVLLAGPSGAGKSDLALRLIDEGAELVADDQIEITSKDGRLMAAAPDTIKGLLEIRHVGLMRMPHRASAPVVLYVELVNLNEKLERLPEEENIVLLDHPIPCLRLPSFAASTSAKIRAALRYSRVTDT